MSGRTAVAGHYFGAEDLGTILAGVSDRRECVRGEGEGQPSGLPVSTEELEMALYLIAFNDEWVPDLTLEELSERGTSARAFSRR